MSDDDTIRMGIYRHYKGPLYLVIGLAHDANADTLCGGAVGTSWDHGLFKPLGERIVVVYVPLQLDGAHTGPRMAVRTLEDFLASVHHDGTPCDGSHCSAETRLVPRFTYLGATLTPDMQEGTRP